ncbi:MAG: ATP-binding protein [Chloroflexi bacterium]|nr:ATP-binding protein [Chloroflexota bacterium]
MAQRLADRLIAERHRRFVGRFSECALLQSAITSPVLPFCVLYVFGPGGVGKTTLLREFGAICRRYDTPAFYVDARNVQPSPDEFVGALRLAMGLDARESPLQVLASLARRHAVLIDTYETLGPLDGWLREVFLPQLPEQTVLVLASRHPLPLAWRTDPGWRTLIQTLPLRNLSPEEGRAYLTQRDVPPEQHQAVLDFTHAHPLALSLVADVFAQRPGTRFQPEAAPDVVKTLLEQFLQKVPGPAHRAALEVCALVHLTTEALLAAILDMPEVHELFDWLRGLSFIESGPQGLFPHDLAREALAADLRWRNPDWYAELHRRARTYYGARLPLTSGQDQLRVLFDYIFLHRDNPVVRPFFSWQESGTALPDAATPDDVPALVAMVAQHEGDESAHLAAHWLARRPEGALVFRDGTRQPAGFLAAVPIQHTGPEDLEVDPAARAAWRALQSRAPLRPGEAATLFRFWMARDTYQGVSPTQSLVFVNVVRHYLTVPGLTFTFFPCADPDFWAPVFAYADLARIPEADFVVGGRRYGVYGHDWRATPPMAWLALLAERETDATPAGALPRAEPLVVLSQPDFAMAVRDALREISRPDVLRANPLVRSRLIAEQTAADATPAERCAALQALVKEAAESLKRSPRDAKYYRALYRTYLHPAPTQEAAAEVLDLPFSTYRRHLKMGIERLAEILWQWELQGVGT